MRLMSMGTQSMPDSARQMRSSGKRTGTPDHSQSAQVTRALTGNRVVNSSSGAYGEREADQPDEAQCRHTTVPVSWHAARNGSQCPVCSDGRPRSTGCSTKLTARKPRSALRRISAAAISGSDSHGSWSGMNRSVRGPTHSSRCQSFQARTQASPNSGSEHREKFDPANPAMSDG